MREVSPIAQQYDMKGVALSSEFGNRKQRRKDNKIMAKTGKNKCKRSGRDGYETESFMERRKNNRKRDKLAKKSRKQNRN